MAGRGTGTILITGATTPLGTAITQLLAEEHPSYTLLLVSRNPSKIAIPQCALLENGTAAPKIITKRLDLSSLLSVHDFATTMATDMQIGLLPPLASIICAAYHCGGRRRMSKLIRKRYRGIKSCEDNSVEDGYERTFQVNYIAHAALVLRLLGYFRRDGGRVVMFGYEDGFERRAGGGEMRFGCLPGIPDDLDDLVEGDKEECQARSESGSRSGSQPDEKKRKKTKRDCTIRALQRYTASRLATVTWVHALNRHLEEDLALGTITAAAININPRIGTHRQKPSASVSLHLAPVIQCITRPFLSLARRYMSPIMPIRTRTRVTEAGEAASDTVGLTTNNIFPFEGGYFDLKDRDTFGIVGTDVSSSSWNRLEQDEDGLKQEALWAKTLEWAGISNVNTALKVEY